MFDLMVSDSFNKKKMSNERTYISSAVQNENIRSLSLYYRMFDGTLMEMLRAKMPLVAEK